MSEVHLGTSVVVQWLGICLPMQGTQIRIPGQGTKVQHTMWQLSLHATTTEPMSCGAHRPQEERSPDAFKQRGQVS